MNRIFRPVFALAGITAAIALAGFGREQGSDASALDAEGVRAMAANLGHELKALNTEAGKEKWQFDVKTTGFNVPIGLELSPSKSYIWLTVSLGPLKASQETKELMKLGAKTQPTQVYLTSKETLMMAMPIENRAVTPAIMKSRIEKLAKDVEESATVWNKQ